MHLSSSENLPETFPSSVVRGAGSCIPAPCNNEEIASAKYGSVYEECVFRRSNYQHNKVVETGQRLIRATCGEMDSH